MSDPVSREAERTGSRASLLGVVLLLAMTVGGPWPSGANEGEQHLLLRHRQWLEEVELLLLTEEREAFLALEQEYDRDLFIRRFWQVRDPFPDTGRNEFRDEWSRRLELARERFGDTGQDPARILLLLGEPEVVSPLLCLQHLWPLEVWRYAPATTPAFHLVLVRSAEAGIDRLVAWAPAQGLGSLMRRPEGGISTGDAMAQLIELECVNGGEILALLAAAVDLEALLRVPDLVPDPGNEWVDAFAARLTELPLGATTFDGTLTVTYPGRLRQRSVVQMILTVPLDQTAAGRSAEIASLGFLVDGQVLRRGESFDRFRYRFDVPVAGSGDDPIPLVMERYLRPGDYTLILRVQDLNSSAFLRRERPLEVPRLQQTAARAASRPLRAPVDRSGADPPVETVHASLAEANRSLAAADSTVQILPPPGQLLTGLLRVEARAAGREIAGIRFLLDGQPLMTKRRPPYAVEVDLGSEPRIHRLEARGLDAEGNETASDTVLINAGPHRFRVRLSEPRPGRSFSTSARLRAEVEVPASDSLDRVEFYLDETLLATLFQPPFVHPVVTPGISSATYVRAVAYLADGNSAEDLVFINAPEHLDQIQVDLVELYTTVTNRRGQLVTDLTAGDFEVTEEGRRQRIRRFERVESLPINAMLVLDTSTSVRHQLPTAERAAHHFFQNIVTAKDRASVIVFNDRPRLVVPFTSDREILAGGLRNLFAEGETALFDAVVMACYNFGGLRGKRALLLISDGSDTRSSYSFESAIAYATAAGVAVYPIAIDVRSVDLRPRMQLEQLAKATGGQAFFIEDANELQGAFDKIETELRSQYLLVYQSSSESSEGFRRVAVELRRPGLRARTIPGYLP